MNQLITGRINSVLLKPMIMENMNCIIALIIFLKPVSLFH